MLTEIAKWDIRVMGVEYDEEVLAELLENPENLDVKKLPKLSSIIIQ